MPHIDTPHWLTAWETYEDPLLFLALVLAISIPLVMWAFRTAQVSIRTRLVYQAAIAVYVGRGYLLRAVEIERGWLTNAAIVVLVIAEGMLLAAIVANSGLLGRRHIPPAQVP